MKNPFRNVPYQLRAITSSINFVDVIIVITGIVLAISIRWSLVGFKSVDYLRYTREWYNTIKSGGFAAFSQNFANYNPPYLYALYLLIRFFPDWPALIVTKIPSMVADFLCAFFVYKIVEIKYPKTPFPAFAFFSILFAPTVVLNSAFWGQADSLYTTALVACVYFLLRQKYFLAFAAYGISISFKFQAIFLMPLLLALLFKNEVPWKGFLVIPFIFFLSLVPSWIAGRSMVDLLSIYLSQANQYEQLTMGAPNVYTWLPNSGRYYQYFYPAGLFIAISACLGYIFLFVKSRAKVTSSLFIEMALISVILVPLFLPKMHDRYFFPSDILSILFAFYFPSYYFVPIVLISVSFFAYQPTLFGANAELLPLLTLMITAIFVFLVRDAIHLLYMNIETMPSMESSTEREEDLPNPIL